MYGQGDGVHDVVLQVLFYLLLLEPVVADVFALAVGDLDAREAVGLGALQLLNVVCVVVADVLAKCRLLVELWHLPLGAALVAGVVGALVPVFEDLHRVGVVLDNHEASVGVGAVEAIRVELRRRGVPGIQGHGETVFWLDLPVVEHPFERKMLEAEGSVCVKEDDELVVANVLGER